jgi:hypothetical protein
MKQQAKETIAHLSFSSERPIAYGQRITLMPDPSSAREFSVAVVRAPEATIRIQVHGRAARTSDFSGETSFVVVRCSSADGKVFSHHAVPVKALEEESEKIEGEVIRLLRDNPSRR